MECFVANAVATSLTKPRYGMTLEAFKNYGVAVSQILRTHHTYIVLVGISSAVADAMPPTNADGTSNQTAQDNAVTQAVSRRERFEFHTRCPEALRCSISSTFRWTSPVR